MLIQDVVWPSHKGEISFDGLGDLTIRGSTAKWTGSLKLELLLTNLSYYHSFFLENPCMGRVDVFSRNKTREIVAEVDLMVLFRDFKVFYLPDQENTLSESFLPGTFSPKTIRRFSIDEWSWDSHLGGFFKEEGVFDIDVPNISVIYAANDEWFSLVKTKITEPISPAKIRGLVLRTSCNLIIDDLAPRVDYRILNMDFLNSLEFLRISALNYQEWIEKCVIFEASDTPHDFLYVRKTIEEARINGKYCVNPKHLVWRSATWNHKVHFDTLPFADWKFLVYVGASSWANMLPNSTQTIPRVFCPESFGLVMSNAIRLPMDVRGLIIRSHFITPTAAEKIIASKFVGHDPLMQSFGLHFVNGHWSSKPSMLAIHKRNHSLGSNFIESCFDGFAKEAAHKLITVKEECPICATDSSTTLLDNCGHVFCESCLKTHVGFGGDACPICRARLDSWTTIKRSTSRYKIEEHISKKIYLETWPPMEDVLVIVPNAVVAEQISTWISPEMDRIMMDSPISKKYKNLILTTSFMRSCTDIAHLHRIFQSAMEDGTTLHVFMDEPLPPWLDDFALCYKGVMQISVYR